MVAEMGTGAHYFLCGSIGEDATLEGKVNGCIQTIWQVSPVVQRYNLSVLYVARTVQ